MESLCWTCQTKNCDWVDRLKPIDGSIALLKKVSEYKAKDRYCIDLIYLQCPKYTGYTSWLERNTGGKRRDFIEQIASMKDGCIYGEGNEFVSITDGYQIAHIAKQRYKHTISLFDQRDEWSIAELATETGLHKSTVSGQIDKALKEGSIEKSNKKKVYYSKDGGRKYAIWTQFYKKAEGVD